MKKWLLVSFLFVSSAYADELPPPQPVESAPRVAPVAPVAPAQPQAVAPAAPPVSAPAATETPALRLKTARKDNSYADESDIPSHFRPNPVAFNAKLGAGSSFGPTAFWLIGDLEAQFDKFVALGPKIQWGESSSVDYLFGSFGPRFIIPVGYFDFGLQGGLGFAYRNNAGFEFTNFLYEAAFNIDFYISRNFSIGGTYTANFLSSQAEDFMSALTFSLAVHL